MRLTRDVIKDEILNFSWSNYGLDEVGEVSYDQWAEDLAVNIVKALSGSGE